MRLHTAVAVISNALLVSAQKQQQHGASAAADAVSTHQRSAVSSASASTTLPLIKGHNSIRGRKQSQEVDDKIACSSMNSQDNVELSQRTLVGRLGDSCPDGYECREQKCVPKPGRRELQSNADARMVGNGDGVPTLAPPAGSSSQPSTAPTSGPSSQPSSTPTAGPSSQPSSQPSSAPTSGPSTQPSSAPTDGPSTLPSYGPTSSPSTQPSSGPTSSPSTQPSSGPTSSPSAQPSSGPTSNLSSLTLSEPTAGSTSQPTSAPTAGPSSQPSSTPTAGPSSQPSSAPSEVQGAMVACITGSASFITAACEQDESLNCCNGDYTCYGFQNATICAGSCNGYYACYYLPEDSEIDTGKCNGFDEYCGEKPYL